MGYSSRVKSCLIHIINSQALKSHSAGTDHDSNDLKANMNWLRPYKSEKEKKKRGKFTYQTCHSPLVDHIHKKALFLQDCFPKMTSSE